MLKLLFLYLSLFFHYIFALIFLLGRFLHQKYDVIPYLVNNSMPLFKFKHPVVLRIMKNLILLQKVFLFLATVCLGMHLIIILEIF